MKKIMNNSSFVPTFLKNILLSLLFAALFISCDSSDKTKSFVPPIVDFDSSMGKGTEFYDWMLIKKDNTQRYNIVKKTYISNMGPQDAPINAPVPKIIHQIWLGPKQPPSFFEEYKRTWIKLNPGWEYRLWTDKEVEHFDFELKDLYDRSVNWGEKSDILRVEILDRFGGVYMDVDFKCVKPFAYLNEHYSFFAGIEPPHESMGQDTTPEFIISNALIGSCPGHPILKMWKESVRGSWDELERTYPESQERVLFRTFLPFGQAITKHLEKSSQGILILPPTYFYPLSFSELSKGRQKEPGFLKKYIFSTLEKLKIKEQIPFTTTKPETMAIHYWRHSWVKSNQERMCDLHNEIKKTQESMNQELDALKKELYELRLELKKIADVN